MEHLKKLSVSSQAWGECECFQWYLIWKLLFLSNIQYFMYVQLSTIISTEFIYYDLWNILVSEYKLTYNHYLSTIPILFEKPLKWSSGFSFKQILNSMTCRYCSECTRKMYKSLLNSYILSYQLYYIGDNCQVLW